VFVPIVLGIALVTLVTWLVVDPPVALARTVAVLDQYACPLRALVLAKYRDGARSSGWGAGAARCRHPDQERRRASSARAGSELVCHRQDGTLTARTARP
jgi:hypothetical protein